MEENRDRNGMPGEETSGRQSGPGYGEPGYGEHFDFGHEESRKNAEFRQRRRSRASGEDREGGGYFSRYDAYRFRIPEPGDPGTSDGGNSDPGAPATGSAPGNSGGPDIARGTGAGPNPGGERDIFPDDPERRRNNVIFGVAIAAMTVILAVILVSAAAQLIRPKNPDRKTASAPETAAVSMAEEAAEEEAKEAEETEEPEKTGEAEETEEPEKTVEAAKTGETGETAPAGSSAAGSEAEEAAEEKPAGEEKTAGEEENAGEEAPKEAAALPAAEAETAGAQESPENSVYSVQEVVRRAMPAMVSITNMTVQEYRSYNGLMNSRDAVSSGSGIIIGITDEAVQIATNYHVIADADDITAAFADDSTAPGTVKGVDADSDLAVIEVAAADISCETRDAIQVITIGDSDALEVGEPVIAIGNALGYGQSVSSGIVSAVNRVLKDSDGTVREMIQTDASINPGNSGGALLNMQGELVGINEIKYVDTTVEGVGYAIPAADAVPILEKLRNSEEKEPAAEGKEAYLGVTIATVPAAYVKNLGYPAGACVIDLTEGGPAAGAGVMINDIITSVEGAAVTSQEDLLEELSYYEAGEEISVTLSRPDIEQGTFSKVSVTITLGSRADAVENGLMNEDGSPVEPEGEEPGEGGPAEGAPDADGPGGEAPATDEPGGDGEKDGEAAPGTLEGDGDEAEKAPDAAEEPRKEDGGSEYDFGAIFGKDNREFNFGDLFR